MYMYKRRLLLSLNFTITILILVYYSEDYGLVITATKLFHMKTITEVARIKRTVSWENLILSDEFYAKHIVEVTVM